MKQSSTLKLVGKLALSLLLAQTTLAQGYDDPLTIQGLDHSTLPSAASRGTGGLTIGIQNDVSLMFSNPASLQTLTAAQVSLGSAQQYSDVNQMQQYGPLKYYSNFSLLMEGLTGYIPNPDSNHVGGTPGDSVQRPYDGLGPDWSRSRNRTQPIQVFAGVPFSIGEMKWAAGAGVLEYADYRLKQMDLDGTVHYTEAVSVEVPGEIPVAYGLEQNYPNPFNPSTTIRYELPKASHVTLKIFNAIGQEVSTLVDEVQEAGHRSVQWNAGSVASGVYFYRLQAGNFVSMKKLLLLR